MIDGIPAPGPSIFTKRTWYTKVLDCVFDPHSGDHGRRGLAARQSKSRREMGNGVVADKFSWGVAIFMGFLFRGFKDDSRICCQYVLSNCRDHCFIILFFV